MPRRLHFVVGTGLLGASLSLGCTDKPPVNEKPVETINEGPTPEEPDHVNVGPVDEPEPPKPEPPEPGPEPIHVNEGPIDEPPQPELKPPPPSEERRVNTRPTNTPPAEL